MKAPLKIMWNKRPSGREGRETMTETPVVLVGPVGDHYGTPSLAVSVLKSSLEGEGIGCRAIYANLLMFEELGIETYAAAGIGDIGRLTLERLFAPMAHGDAEGWDLTRLSGYGMPEGEETFYRVIKGEPKRVSAAAAAKAADMAPMSS